MTYFSVFEIHNNGGSLERMAVCMYLVSNYYIDINKSRDKDGVFCKPSPTSTILSSA